jgi:hypothetical protein
MSEFSQIGSLAKIMDGMSLSTLVAIVMLSAFGLAAYSIAAVVKVTNKPGGKGGRNGN